MKNVDEQVLRDAARLKNGKLHEWLVEFRTESMELLSESNDDNEIRRLQGEVATLKVLIEMIESARDKLEPKQKINTSKMF